MPSPSPIPDTSTGGSPASRPGLQHWFPVAFERDLATRDLTRVTVHGVGVVVYRAKGGELTCLRDRCPHRHARLSDGRLVDGNVECLYHGWQFEKTGACVHIPQLAKDQAIPARACADALPVRVIDGLVWIFPGEVDAARLPAPPASLPDLASADVHVIDFATDLPYDQAALIENVLDFAHIHIAHDGVRGGGHRSSAGPLRFQIDEQGAEGFSARFLTRSSDAGEEATRTAAASVAFRAPGLVHYVSKFNDVSRVSGLALYSVPLSKNRCRLLYRAYGSLFPDSDKKRPRWKEHLHQMFLLEQDMAVVLGQSRELAATGEPMERSWMPIKSSDQLVLRYRQWLDEHAADLPGMIGWKTRNADQSEANAPRPATDRYTLHTRHCTDCLGALRQERSLLKGLGAGAAVAVLLAAALPFPLGLPALVAAIALGWRARLAYQRAESLTSDPLSDGQNETAK